MPATTVLPPRIALHPEGLALANGQGQQRGWVDPKHESGRPVLEDLWVMQGSICDLRCRHCYTASSPQNERLEQITSAELRPHLDEAARFGVNCIYFTGGEVFVNRDVLERRARQNHQFLASLEYALEIAPVEVLTNARRYIGNYLGDLARLRKRHGDRLRLRITLESPEAAEHDALRGRGTFEQTVASVIELGRIGFTPVITAERPFLAGKRNEDIREAYEALFRPHGVRIEVSLIENVMEMGHHLVQLSKLGTMPAPEVFVTTECFAQLGKPAESLMCHFSRCIQKIDGALRYYPCPVIYDDSRFELGRTLEESFRRVYVAHKNCYDYCLKGSGGTCRTRTL